MLPTAPAIVNAIQDAVGVRLRDLPVTPEKILKALEEQRDGKPYNVTVTRREQTLDIR